MSEYNYGLLGASHHHRPMPRSSHHRHCHNHSHGHGHGHSQGGSHSELEWKLANERKRTLTEWTHHLDRISSPSSAESSSNARADRAGAGPRRWGSPGGYAYNGLYKHMNRVEYKPPATSPQGAQRQPTDWKYKNDPACLRASELFRQEQNRLRKRGLAVAPISSWETGAHEQEPENGTGNKSSSQSQPIFVSEAEIADIERCFIAADVTQDGYLSCEEFKNFMEYRGAPITHLEARKLLHRTDPVYHSLINLDQLMFLVLSCGLSTQNERTLTPEEFNNLIERVRSVTAMPLTQDAHNGSNFDARRTAGMGPSPSATVIDETHELTGAISYFEDIASHVQLKQSQEERYHEYRREIRQERVRESNANARHNGSDPAGSHVHAHASLNYYPPPPGWKNMVLHSQDPSWQLPPLNFRKLKGEWETTVVASEEQRRTEQDNSLQNPNRSRGILRTETADDPRSQPMPLSKCREILMTNRERRSPSPSRTGTGPNPKPETNTNASTPAVEASPSLSFATELRQVLQVYKARADGFTSEASGKRVLMLNPEAASSGLESPHILFANKDANSSTASSQISVSNGRIE